MALSQPTAPLTGAAQAVPAATTPPPAGREPRSYLPFLGFANLGVYMALLTPVMVSMAFKIDHLVGAEAAPAQLGMVMGVGALFALICNPLAGRLSDRTTSRLGMRRPWIIGGAIVGAAALAVVGTAQSVALVLVGWCVAQAAFNAVLAAANATIPDQVPVERRGKVSGLVGMATPLAILLGSVIVNQISADGARFIVPAALGLIFSLLFAAVLRDRAGAGARTAVHRRAVLRVVRLQPAQAPRLRLDLADQVHGDVRLRGHRDVPAVLPGGQVRPVRAGGHRRHPHGDVRVGRRHGHLQPGRRHPVRPVRQAPPVRRRRRRDHGGRPRRPRVRAVHRPGLVGQAIIGLGAGAFFSVDIALATQVLPSKDDTAKDLGVLNIANALPQSLAPAMAPAILAVRREPADGPVPHLVPLRRGRRAGRCRARLPDQGCAVMTVYHRPRMPRHPPTAARLPTHPARRRARRGPARPDDARGEGRPALPAHDHDRRGRHARRQRPGLRAAVGEGVRARQAHVPLEPAGGARQRARDRRVAQPAPGAVRGDPPRHPRDDRDRPPARVHRQPRHRAALGPVLAVARDPRARGDARRGAHGAARRRRPAGVPGRRPAHRAAPAGRPGHRAALGARQRHLRRGRRVDRAHGRRVRARVPGSRLRRRQRLDDDQALPRRRAAEGRRGPALRVRPRAGLPGRAVRRAPGAVQGAPGGRDAADDAVLRHAGRAAGDPRGRVRVQQARARSPEGRPRLRRHHLHRLGPGVRRRGVRAAVPGARVGRRAPLGRGPRRADPRRRRRPAGWGVVPGGRRRARGERAHRGSPDRRLRPPPPHGEVPARALRRAALRGRRGGLGRRRQRRVPRGRARGAGGRRDGPDQRRDPARWLPACGSTPRGSRARSTTPPTPTSRSCGSRPPTSSAAPGSRRSSTRGRWTSRRPRSTASTRSARRSRRSSTSTSTARRSSRRWWTRPPRSS